jgi:phosphopantothenoylcysteine decarboxylase / phosphopantothenate---cysteine ligase
MRENTVLNNKTIILGITGGIAAYKAADLASQLTQSGAKVEVIMTEAAMKFITPLTLRAITNRPVVTSMFELASEWSIEHVSLAETADVVVVAPATADIIAKLTAGIADEMILSTILATRAPVIIAPAMDVNMFESTITQDNINKLRNRGYVIVEPGFGRLASGKIGSGRLAENLKIIGIIKKVLGKNGDMAGKRIVITAGGTQEPIDPVRIITNRSSGKMGYALAEAARDRGAEVSLITAATSITDPSGIEIIHVSTAIEMEAAVLSAVKKTDALIMAAAVADYMPQVIAKGKIKKTGDKLTLELVRTPDILSEVKGNFVKVGFAAESEDVFRNAESKLKRKQLDFIVANDITDTSSGFGVDTNKVIIIDKNKKVDNLPLMTKREVADKILDKLVERLVK